MIVGKQTARAFFMLTCALWSGEVAAQSDKNSAVLQRSIKAGCSVEAWQFQMRPNGRSGYSIEMSPTLSAKQHDCVLRILKSSKLDIPALSGRY
jgi:hypothetical protein